MSYFFSLKLGATPLETTTGLFKHVWFGSPHPKEKTKENQSWLLLELQDH